MKSLGKFLGELKIVIGQASPYLTIITASMMAATFYHTTLIEWVGVIGVNLPLWVFFIVIIVGGIAVIWFERKYMVRGYFEAWTEQWWGNDNEMKNSMEKLQSDMDEMRADMAEMKEILKGGHGEFQK